jgi:hypothetical protein
MTTKRYIHYDEDKGKVVCDALGMEADSVADLKRQIAEFDKKEKAKIKPTPVIYFDSWRDKKEPIFGIAGAKHSDGEHWVTYERKGQKRREVVDDNRLYLDTPEQRNKIESLVRQEATLAKADAVLKNQWQSLDTIKTLADLEAKEA